MRGYHHHGVKINNKLEKPIVFFCKDCEKIVDVKPIGRKFVYTCAICKTKNVAFGTEDAVKSFYRITEGESEKEQGKDADKDAKQEVTE